MTQMHNHTSLLNYAERFKDSARTGEVGMEPSRGGRAIQPGHSQRIPCDYLRFGYNPLTMQEFPKAQTVFVSSLVPGYEILKNRNVAAHARDWLANLLNNPDSPDILVLDLDGISYTPSTLQELILPLAQRIRGGEHGTVRLAISTTDSAVRDFIRYMAQAHQLPIYFSPSPRDLREGTPVGALTRTERSTLDTIINVLGGRVTASILAETEGIKPSAATNRLVNLDRGGYLFRQPRGRREGDLYIEPRSATSISISGESVWTAASTGSRS